LFSSIAVIATRCKVTVRRLVSFPKNSLSIHATDQGILFGWSLSFSRLSLTEVIEMRKHYEKPVWPGMGRASVGD
jgi:hypothetical protein